MIIKILTHSNNSQDGYHQKSSPERLNLPEPDHDNITVLSHNLPNKPILPWNRYDSPWKDKDKQDQQEKGDTEEKQPEAQDNSLKEDDTELDEVE